MLSLCVTPSTVVHGGRELEHARIDLATIRLISLRRPVPAGIDSKLDLVKRCARFAYLGARKLLSFSSRAVTARNSYGRED